MRRALAEKLLIEIMEWSTEEVSEERPLLQALSNFKYNEYQQFSIGTLFIESLVKWLSQFESCKERKVAYAFIKTQLIFFSNNQILHLVNTTFSTVIQPILIEKTAAILNISKYQVSTIINSSTYNSVSRRTLYIGLSDGARIDQLRRSSYLNNEQVIPTYEVGPNKVTDMLKELSDSGETEKFDTVFLVDDFTASGTSYFRHEGDELNGKIFKTINSFFDEKKTLFALVDSNRQIDIHLIFYMATEEAKTKISKIQNILSTKPEYQNLNFKIHVLQQIDSTLKDQILKSQKDFIELSKKYIDKTIVDRHWEKAKNEKYYLGYNECGLPIVLAHNTPNNSLPLLWWTSKDNEFVGLFPRITRHS